MKSNRYSGPESFSLSPLLALLPVKGQIAKLATLTASFYARYEKVTHLLAELEQGAEPEIKRRLNAELQMLKQVLDFLAVKPELESQ